MVEKRGSSRSLTLIVVSVAFLCALAMMVMHHMYTQQAGVAMRARIAKDLTESRSIHGNGVVSSHVEAALTTGRHADTQGVPKHYQRPDVQQYPPYLSLGERFNATSGEIFRDNKRGDDTQVMKWHEISHTKPRAYYIENFWEDEETAWVRDVAGAKLKRSEIVGQKGQSRSDGVRTSNGMFITDQEHARNTIITAARKRVAMLTNLQEENVEATQILRYEAGQRYQAHPDYFSTIYTEHLARGGQRVATLLSWLDDTTEGGETTFPMSSNPQDEGRSYKVKPKKGDAIVFWNCEKVCLVFGVLNGFFKNTFIAIPPDIDSVFASKHRVKNQVAIPTVKSQQKRLFR